MPNTESKNSVSTSGTAYIVDLLCEGEIEGLVDNKSSLYFDEVSYFNNGAAVFPSVQFDESTHLKVGTADQTRFGDKWAGANVPIKLGNNTLLRANKPIVNYVSTSIYPDAVSALVTLRFGSFFRNDNDLGDIRPTSVRLHIKVSHNGGAFGVASDIYIEEKSNEGFIKAFPINLPRDGNAKFNSWKIAVERITPDSESVKINDQCSLDSIVIRTNNKYRYPNTAMARLQFDSATFPNLPQRSYECRLLKVKVPSNYTPTAYNSDGSVSAAASYAGVWDGTFANDKVWTNNPAWIYYDLLTNKRYGLGEFVDGDQIDKWTLYSISQYCDELIDDGYGGGGQEPRFTANTLLTTTEEAYTVLSHLASIFRGMTYWLSNKVFLSQDKTKLPVQTFTNANVVDGLFNYSSSKRAQRRTVAMVRWNDPDDFYRKKYERIEDDVGILKYGIREMEMAAFACSSRGQAIRAGQWALFTERNETEIVNFEVGLEGLYSRPGDVIRVYDDFRINRKQGGRVLTMNNSRDRVYLDRLVETDGGYSYALHLQIPQKNRDPSYTGTDTSIKVTSSDQVDEIREEFIETQEVASFGTVSGITYVDVNSAFSERYIGNAFILDVTDVSSGLFYRSKLYRLMSVKENSERNSLELMGVEYSSGKFAAAETGFTTVSTANTDYTGAYIAPPTNLVVTGSFDYYQENSSAWIYVDASWSGSTGEYVDYHVASGRQLPSGDWEHLYVVNGTSARYHVTGTGNYEISVHAVQIGGKTSSSISDSWLFDENPLSGPPPMGEIIVFNNFEPPEINDYNTTPPTEVYNEPYPSVLFQISGTGEYGDDVRRAFVSSYSFHFRDDEDNVISSTFTSTQPGIDPDLFSSDYITGWPLRTIRVVVTALDWWGNSGSSASAYLVNPAPPEGSLNINSSFPNSMAGSISPDYDIDEHDFSGHFFWIHPSGGNLISEATVYTGYALNTFQINHNLNTTGDVTAWYATVDNFSLNTGELNINGPFSVGGAGVGQASDLSLTLSGFKDDYNNDHNALVAEWTKATGDLGIAYQLMFLDTSGMDYHFTVPQTPSSGERVKYVWTSPVPDRDYSFRVKAFSSDSRRGQWTAYSSSQNVPKDVIRFLHVQGKSRFEDTTYVDIASTGAAGTVVLDCGESNIFVLSVSAECTLAPINIQRGATYMFYLNGVGQTINFNSSWYFPSDQTLPLTIASPSVVSAAAFTTGALHAVYTKDFQQA